MPRKTWDSEAKEVVEKFWLALRAVETAAGVHEWDVLRYGEPTKIILALEVMRRMK